MKALIFKEAMIDRFEDFFTAKPRNQYFVSDNYVFVGWYDKDGCFEIENFRDIDEAQEYLQKEFPSREIIFEKITL